MSPSLALIISAVGIGGLFFLNRDSSSRTSKALWLPVVWVWINSSRPLSVWLGIDMTSQNAPGQIPDTSLLDQFVAGLLMLSGIIVLLRRRREVMALLKASWPIVLFFSYCLLSLIGSDFPGWGFKRWVRAVGELMMILIVATDAQPAKALGRFVSRVGFLLLPASVLLVKYYPALGQDYDEWGAQMNTGVTKNKNMLGVLTFVITLGALWQVITLLRDKKQHNRNRRLLAQATLLLFGISLLHTTHSATSGVCFALGAVLLVATALPLARRGPAAIHAVALALLISGGLAVMLGAESVASNALGRGADLNGRTEVWNVIIPMVPNSVLGAGFETFWLGPRTEAISAAFNNTFVNESHNGYIEVYLNLGWAGIGLIALLLLHGYGKAVGAFRRDPALGSLLVAFVVTSAFYNITEAGFRMLGAMWFFLLLAVLSANRITIASEDLLRSREEATGAVPFVADDAGSLAPNPSWTNI